MAEMTGHLIPVVGPSGAGKDSVIRGARTYFEGRPEIVFPRRVVTRKADVVAEDHDSLSEMAFAIAVAKDEFALWWEAHDKAYGIPAGMEADLQQGRTVVFNCSRAILGEVVARFPNVTIVEVTAAPEVLVERIVTRGRESRSEAVVRVSRLVPELPVGAAVLRIDNSSALANAVSALCRLVEDGHASALPFHSNAELDAAMPSPL